jgi:hypothetical protein
MLRILNQPHNSHTVLHQQLNLSRRHPLKLNTTPHLHPPRLSNLLLRSNQLMQLIHHPQVVIHASLLVHHLVFPIRQPLRIRASLLVPLYQEITLPLHR